MEELIERINVLANKKKTDGSIKKKQLKEQRITSRVS